MALGSLANTTKISGTKVNTVWVDEWDKVLGASKTEKPVYLEYNANPLALVCAMIRKGKQPYEAAEVLNGVGTRLTRQIDIIPSIEREDTDRANTILRYFAKKHTMRRIKGEWVSEYMLAIDEIVENPKRINKEYVPILVTLPRIYEQNNHLERIIKGRNSVKHTKSLPYAAMHTELEFVDRVRIKHGNRDEMHYYWSTPKNYLVRFVVPYNQYGMSAWDFITSQGKIGLDSEVVHTYQIKGYNFNVLQPNPAHMEIKSL